MSLEQSLADLGETVTEAENELARLARCIGDRYPDDQVLGDRLRAFLRARERMAHHLRWELSLLGRTEPPAA